MDDGLVIHRRATELIFFRFSSSIWSSWSETMDTGDFLFDRLPSSVFTQELILAFKLSNKETSPTYKQKHARYISWTWT